MNTIRNNNTPLRTSWCKYECVETVQFSIPLLLAWSQGNPSDLDYRTSKIAS